MTVIVKLVSELHPVALLVNINFAIPCDIPVTRPALFTVATAGAVLIHVPPELGDKFVVFPIQSGSGPFTKAIGLPLTIIGAVGSESQPAFVVNTNLADPF